LQNTQSTCSSGDEVEAVGRKPFVLELLTACVDILEISGPRDKRAGTGNTLTANMLTACLHNGYSLPIKHI